MDEKLAKAFDFYLEHQAELVTQYDGKFVVIKDGKVLGAYADEAEAVRETKKSHEIGTFIVQRVSPGDTAYTQTFHSRASFA